MIPHIRRLFAEVMALLATSDGGRLSMSNSESGNQSSAIEHTNGNGNGNGNGHHSHDHDPNIAQISATDYTGWSDEKRHEAAYRLLNALQSQGIVIQDVERGLIDFPSIRDGREVFLCYELSDGLSIGYFHDIDAGFAGRQEITENNSE